MLVLPVHELSEKSDERYESGERRGGFFVGPIHLETLIVEHDPAAVSARHGIDAQRQIAFVSLVAGRTGQNQRAVAHCTSRSDDDAANNDRLQQHELKSLTGLAFVGR